MGGSMAWEARCLNWMLPTCRAEILFLALGRVFLVGSGWEVDGPRMLAEGSREGHHWRSLENSQLDSGTDGRIPVFFGRLGSCVTCGTVT